MLKREVVWKIAEIVKNDLNLKIPIKSTELVSKLKKLDIKCIAEEDLNEDAIFCIINDEYIIKYNMNLSESSKVFSILAEFGYFLIYDHENKHNFKSNIKTQKQRLNCNEFAASILMPANDFCFICKKYENKGEVNVNKIAEYFNTTIQATLMRGNVLRVWSY